MNLDEMRKRQRAAAGAADGGAEPALTRPRREDEGLDFSQALGESMYNIWTLANKGEVSVTDRSKVEVEIRFGMVILDDRRWRGQTSRKRIVPVPEQMRQALRLRFEAGVDEHYIEHLGQILVSDKFERTPQPAQRMRCDDISHRRWAVDANDRVSIVEEKRRFSRIDLALLSHIYDLRLDAAIELPIAQSASASHDLNPDRWQIERLKRRVTYRSKNPQMSAWKIDVTEVDVLQKQQGGSSVGSAGSLKSSSQQYKEVEVEFELENAAAVAWLSEEPTRAVDHTRSIVWQLTQLINLCIPGCEEVAEENLKDAPKDSLREICKWNDILKSADGATSSSLGRVEFLGSMPVNMNRRSLLNVQRNSYFLTEKSDGTRYLLYVIKDASNGGQPLAVIMDRAKKVLCFRGAEVIGAALHVGTILDGELVYNRTMKETVFLVFDVLAIDGTPVLQLPFSRRLELITRRDAGGIIARCEPVNAAAAATSGAGATASATPTPRPILLVRKNFVDKTRISELLGNIRMDERDGERTYRDSDRRHHKSDGIIFQPDAPYKFFADIDLLKWKWTDLRSVDLQAVLGVGNGSSNSSGKLSNPPPIQLFCSGPDGSQVDCTKRGGLGTFDAYRLRADTEDLRVLGQPHVPRIAEVVFNAGLGQWIYMKLREDKTDPNFIDTVMGVFMEQAEAISVEELEYRMLGTVVSGGEDDFAAQLNKMKKKLLEFQRSKSGQKVGGVVSSGSSGGSSSSSAGAAGGGAARTSSSHHSQPHQQPPLSK